MSRSVSRGLELCFKTLVEFESRQRTRRPLVNVVKRRTGGVPPAQRGEFRRRLGGAIRHRYTLRLVVGGLVRRAFKKASHELTAALGLAAWMALDEDPELAGLPSLVGKRKDRDKTERAIAELQAARVPPPEDPAELAAWLDEGRIVPLQGEDLAAFAKPVLELAGRAPAARLAMLFSLPEELVSGWVEAFGEDEAGAVCRASNTEAPLFGRVNPLQTDMAALRAALASAGVIIRALGEDQPGAFVIEDGRADFTRTEPFRAGHFTIQDLTAQAAARAVAAEPGERILDLCAAPGGKTTALAEQSRDRAEILAVDRKESRLGRVDENATRLKLSSIRAICADGRNAEELAAACDGAGFDAILLDAPCSNTGVLRRRDEARWRFSRKGQARFPRDQAQLLEVSSRLLKPGGRLIYSLCSIEPDEGTALVHRLAEPLGLTVAHEELHKPTAGGGDGGYFAKLTRN